MPVVAHERRLYRGRYRIYTLILCPTCGFKFSADHIEHYANIVRARRNRRGGRNVSVRHLRMFIEIARLEIDWDSTWVSLDDLYHIIEYVSQMDNEDSMDVDIMPLAINDVLDQLESLSVN